MKAALLKSHRVEKSEEVERLQAELASVTAERDDSANEQRLTQAVRPSVSFTQMQECGVLLDSPEKFPITIFFCFQFCHSYHGITKFT